MKRNRFWISASLSLLALGGLGLSETAGFALVAQEKSRSDQGEARKEMRAGNQLPLREIERRILPQMQDSQYLRAAYDAVAHAYRLKFIKDGRVTYIDVDARTGRIINRSR